MIEIGVLIFLCSKMRNLLYERGWDRTFWMQFLVVAVWFLTEFVGALTYGIVVAMRDGEAAVQNIGFMAYPPALLAAIIGQVVLFLLVRSFVGKTNLEPDETAVYPIRPPVVDAIPVSQSAMMELSPATPLPVTSSRHSRWGIASFALACLSTVSMIALFAVIGYKETAQPGIMDEDSVAAMMVGFFAIALAVLSLIALGTGIVGLIKKGHRKPFAVLGTCIAGLTVLGVTALVLL